MVFSVLSKGEFFKSIKKNVFSAKNNNHIVLICYGVTLLSLIVCLVALVPSRAQTLHYGLDGKSQTVSKEGSMKVSGGEEGH